ncbi:MAG: type II secretion system protein [Candidatus Aphodocola sp.]
MKKLNKKGFTLIELLAVIVILAILVAVAVPAVTRYLTTARKGTYADNAQSAISAVRNDVISQFGAANNRVYYLNGACIKDDAKTSDTTKSACETAGGTWNDGINSLLEKKLVKSSYGNNYKDDSYISVKYDPSTGAYLYHICLTDGTYGIEDDEADITDASVKTDGSVTCTKVDYAS